MKIDRKYLIELITSSESSYYYKCEPYLDTINKRIWATNGGAAVIIPVQNIEEDTDGPITAESLKTARKFDKKDPYIYIKATDQLKTPKVSYSRSTIKKEKLPSIDKVIPKNHLENEVSISFNAKILYDLARAMGADKKDCQVTISFDAKSPHNPIKVDTDYEAIGVFMPVRR